MAAQPLPPHGAHRRRPFGRYGAPISNLRTPRGRADAGESTPGQNAAEEGAERRAPWPAAMEFSGEHGQGAREHASTWEMAEKIAEKGGSSPTRRKRRGRSNSRIARAEVAGDGFLCAASVAGAREAK